MRMMPRARRGWDPSLANNSDTVVFQSHRAQGLPAWITRSLATTRQWAAASGYDYVFFDDTFFEPVPDWFKAKAKGVKTLLADLARLLAAKKFLADGYRRAIWIDADVVVFAPEKLILPRESKYYFCREVWIDSDAQGLIARNLVNNCVCVFEAGNAFLDFYIESVFKLAELAKGAMLPQVLGTVFLSNLDQLVPIPKLTMIGLFSPGVIRDIVQGGGNYLTAFKQCYKTPIHAANILASFSGRSYNNPDGTKFQLNDAVFNRVVDILLAAGGDFTKV